MQCQANRLLRDTRGTTVIEVALGLPLLLACTLSIVDLAQVSIMRLRTQQYANTGSELAVMTGSNVPTNEQIANQIAADNGIPISSITIVRWTECNFVSQGLTGACPNSLDLRADYLKVTVQSSYSPVLLNPSLGGWVPELTYTAYSTARIK